MADACNIEYTTGFGENDDVSQYTTKDGVLSTSTRFSNTVSNGLYEGLNAKTAEERDRIYDNVFIDGRSVNEQVEEMTDAQGQDKEKICANLVAKSHMQGKLVKAKPFGAKPDDDLVTVTSSGKMPKISMSAWEKFWNFLLGFYNEKAEAIKANNEQANNEFVEKKAKDVLNYVDSSSGAQKKIEKMYMEGVDEKDLNDEGKEKIKNGEVPSPYSMGGKVGNYSPRAFMTLTNCMMLMKGHSLKEISDPNFVTDRKEVGNEIATIITDLRSSDEKIVGKAEQQVANIYVEGTKKFLAQPMPSKEEWSNLLTAENPNYLATFSLFGQDVYQEFNNERNKELIMKASPENDILSDKAVLSSRLGNPMAGRVMQGSKNFTDSRTKQNAVNNFCITSNYAMDACDFSGKTVEEACIINEKNVLRASVASTVTTQIETNFDGTAKEVLLLSDLEGPNKDFIKLVNSNEKFKETFAEQLKLTDEEGFISSKEQKCWLATETAKKMLGATKALDGKSEKTKKMAVDKIASNIYGSDSFKEHTRAKPVNEIKEFDKSMEFLRDVTVDYAKNTNLEALAKKMIKMAPCFENGEIDKKKMDEATKAIMKDKTFKSATKDMKFTELKSLDQDGDFLKSVEPTFTRIDKMFGKKKPAPEKEIAPAKEPAPAKEKGM